MGKSEFGSWRAKEPKVAENKEALRQQGRFFYHFSRNIQRARDSTTNKNISRYERLQSS